MMDEKILSRLQKLNQLKLTETEVAEVLSYFKKLEEDIEGLSATDTENVERMVHVIPLTNVLREDVAKKIYTRDQLQADAPESSDGYWQVPRLVE